MLSDLIRMADDSIPIDIITAIFRGRGYRDDEIRARYNYLIDTGDYDIVVEKGVPRFERI